MSDLDLIYGTKPKTPTSPDKSILQEKQPNLNPSEQGNARTPVRSNDSTPQRTTRQRIITRNSFEIYEDQMELLRKLSYREKMEGKLGSMSGMVRQAIDYYLQKRTSEK
jgi:hypothetical protein